MKIQVANLAKFFKKTCCTNAEVQQHWSGPRENKAEERERKRRGRECKIKVKERGQTHILAHPAYVHCYFIKIRAREKNAQGVMFKWKGDLMLYKLSNIGYKWIIKSYTKWLIITCESKKFL
jgi:hypothetical protein